MPTSPSRREFLHQLSWAGASVAVLGADGVAAQVPGAAQLANDHFQVGFDPASGRLSVWHRDGRRFLEESCVRAVVDGSVRSTAGGDYRHVVDAGIARDELGEGRRLVVRSTDEGRRLDFELVVTLYEGKRIVSVECRCRNVSRHPLVLERLEPVCARLEEGGGLRWSGLTKVLTNGAMYSDPGSVVDFMRPGAEGLRSWWNVGLFSGYEREGLVCGYVRNQAALGQVVLERGPGDAVGLVAESVLAKGFVLEPGREVVSEPFVLIVGRDSYAALEAYGDAMGMLGGARLGSVLHGWCSWFYTYEHVTEGEVVRNAEHAARMLKPFGLECIQVDEGCQRWHGEWESNERFPHGMKWLADRIRRLGLKPGIWIAPYVISEPTEVFRKHPEWLLRHPDGRLKRVGPWPSEDSDWARGENPKRYGLDVTHPGAAAWMTELFGKVVGRWGYEMIKIDFVEWSLLSAHRYHDPGVTRARAYRRGFEIMRRAMGPEGHLQDCGPGPVTVGLLDSMRIELDQNYGFRKEAWKQYFGSPTGSAAAAAKRYYFHRRAWINDADHVCLHLLSTSQAQAAATLIALTGGNVLSGDRLPDLDATRLGILKKILPSGGEGARPVDLFDSDRQTVFAVKVRKQFGEWTVVGLFNPDEAGDMERVLPVERMWLDPARVYLAYDFWREGLVGEVKGELKVRVPAAGVTLLALREKTGVPQVIGTDRHVLQGAVELEEAGWDAATATMSGVSRGPKGTAHNVMVYVPESKPWRQGGPVLYRDFPGCTARMVDAQVLRVRVRFEKRERVAWRVGFKELFGAG